MTETPKPSQHNRAMDLADEGERLRAKGDHRGALKNFRDAADLEEDAANTINSDIQPGHGVLHRSAATLAIDANLVDKALEIAEAGLEAAPPPALEIELKQLVELATARKTKTRHTTRPHPLALSVLRGLRMFFPDLHVETSTEGRVIRRPSAVPTTEETTFWLYRDAEDFEAWKTWSWNNEAFPPRIRLSIDREPSTPRVTIELFAPASSAPNFFKTTFQIISTSVLPTDLNSDANQRAA